MAKPGYGKRTAPGQQPRGKADFDHLLPRDAAIAGYLDRLPDGADISVKTLAKTTTYGQCALRTSLNRIQAAGHLRRGQEKVTSSSGTELWVTRTFFSRTARADEWWAAFTRGDVPPDNSEPPPSRSRAVILLAALSRTAPSLFLSAAECAQLAPLVEEWFARGAGSETVRTALTAGLPHVVHSPAALLRRRLVDKMPPPVPVRPVVPVVPEGQAVRPVRLLECSECGVPGKPEALPGGLCKGCTGSSVRPVGYLDALDVRSQADTFRASIRMRPRVGTR
ncbi:hypothetical protein PV682_26965 [Streptomyces niveiscabiei]|uniref:hypothetical protein n=1 Tax=Streptomyces niveiscabiei TaxID=164115 RepID=UPI0029A9F58E|nr:hypothetical protein [Streptomyces niveiscabiei]MDX3385091.1 hypothetical protein [Streptomyces niveiscabiei]